jgi:hypothetical protein
MMRRLVTIHYLPYFSGKSSRDTFFAGAFNALNVHQICQTLHEIDHQTSLYVWVWSSPVHWHINGSGTTPKRPPQAACSCKLTVHHAYFEPTVEILLNRIKGWNLFPYENKITLFHPYK